MVKRFKKDQKIHLNTINSVLIETKPAPKSKKQIDEEYYQKNKERKKARRKELYAQQKKQTKITTKQKLNKYCGAESIKVLISLKEYTELNQHKHKLWADFKWTLKDCAEDVHDIVAIMKLREVAENLINDYWKTAKNFLKLKKGKSWNSLSEEQQNKLIKYWAQEKARKENNYLEVAEQLEKQSQEYCKEIELAKFHEQRGKIKCSCYDCQAKKEIQAEIKKDYDQSNKAIDKKQCPECQKWVKELKEESRICKICAKKYE